MELVGDGGPEDAPGLGVEGLQRGSGQIGGHLSGHIQVLVEDEFHLAVGFAAPADLTGSGVELHPAAAPDGDLRIHSRAAHARLGDLLVGHDAQIFFRDQLPEGGALQLQRPAGDEIHIPQTDALKISGLVDLDEGRQGLVQLRGEILPAAVAGAGQGDEFGSQVHPPHPVGGDELIIDGGGLVLQLQIARNAGELRSRGLHPGAVARIIRPDGLLEVDRRLGPDGQDLGKTQLTDYLAQLVFPVDDTRFVGKHGINPFQILSVIINPTEEKGKGGQELFTLLMDILRRSGIIDSF